MMQLRWHKVAVVRGRKAGTDLDHFAILTPCCIARKILCLETFLGRKNGRALMIEAAMMSNFLVSWEMEAEVVGPV